MAVIIGFIHKASEKEGEKIKKFNPIQLAFYLAGILFAYGRQMDWSGLK